jgi:hypothetical protein
MIEFKLLNKNNSPVTLDNMGGVSAAIGCIYSEQERERVGSKIRETYEINGHKLHIYYGEKSTDICIPLKYEKEIKDTLKCIAQLKFGKN